MAAATSTTRNGSDVGNGNRELTRDVASFTELYFLCFIKMAAVVIERPPSLFVGHLTSMPFQIRQRLLSLLHQTGCWKWSMPRLLKSISTTFECNAGQFTDRNPKFPTRPSISGISLRRECTPVLAAEIDAFELCSIVLYEHRGIRR